MSIINDAIIRFSNRISPIKLPESNCWNCGRRIFQLNSHFGKLGLCVYCNNAREYGINSIKNKYNEQLILVCQKCGHKLAYQDKNGMLLGGLSEGVRKVGTQSNKDFGGIESPIGEKTGSQPKTNIKTTTEPLFKEKFTEGIDPITGESYGSVVRNVDISSFSGRPSEYGKVPTQKPTTFKEWQTSPSGYSSEFNARVSENLGGLRQEVSFNKYNGELSSSERQSELFEINKIALCCEKPDYTYDGI